MPVDVRHKVLALSESAEVAWDEALMIGIDYTMDVIENGPRERPANPYRNDEMVVSETFVDAYKEFLKELHANNEIVGIIESGQTPSPYIRLEQFYVFLKATGRLK